MEVGVGVGVEVEHPNVQIPKWPHDADAASDRIIAYTATPLGVNNSPVLSEREPGYRSSSFPMTDSPPMTELYGYRIEFMVRDSKKPNGENDITILAANGRISQLRVKRSREGDDHVQEVTFTASDSSGGETHAAVAVRSADAERQHSIRFMPDKPNDYAIELVVRGGLVAHGADAVTVKAVDADINQLRAERSGEGDAQIQEITFTASDGSGGEMRGVVRSAAKQFAVNISRMYEVRSIRPKRENSPLT